MHSPCKRPTSAYDYLLGVLTTITVPLIAVRILYAAGVITIPNRITNAATSIATVLFMVTTLGLAWRRSVLHSRTERAELTRRVEELEKRVAETEDAAWWGTPLPEAEAEPTIGPGTTVVPFRHRQSQQRGAS